MSSIATLHIVPGKIRKKTAKPVQPHGLGRKYRRKEKYPRKWGE